MEGGERRLRGRPLSRELREMSTQWRDSLVNAGREERARMSGVKHLLKRGFQAVHFVVAFGFLVLAVVEFIRDPPYFDAVAAPRHANTTNIPSETFYNLTRQGAPGSIRHVMDLPVLLLFVCYFVVMIWRGAWGVWSMMMTLSMVLILLVFIIINYWAHDLFDWRFFHSRGLGVIIEVFCFAFAWNCVAMATFVKTNQFPFRFSEKPPENLCLRFLLVLWNFFAVLTFLFFCLLIWFSRLYYSWVCVHSINDVLLMCQFSNHVQCYACAQAETCTHLDLCVSNAKAKSTFHCESPLAGLHDVDNAFCIFNYNIGFFTFIMALPLLILHSVVFAYVGGTYFFLSNVFNFAVSCVKEFLAWFFKLMRRKTGRHFGKLYTFSISLAKRGENGKDDTEVYEEEDEVGGVKSGIREEERRSLLSAKDDDSDTDDDNHDEGKDISINS